MKKKTLSHLLCFKLCGPFFLLLLLCSCIEQSGLPQAENLQEKHSKPGDSVYTQEFAKMDSIRKECMPLWNLQEELPVTRVGDWLYFNREKEQSLRDYIRNRPITVTSTRPVLYLRKIGDFSDKQAKQLPAIKEFLEMYFQCPVKWQQPVSLQQLGAPGLFSQNDKTGNIALSSIYLTDNILKPELPSDGWGVLAITGNEIHKTGNKGEQYGDAMLYGRAAVVSLFYFDGSGNRKLLERSLKGASHEASHMLSIPHCTRFYCNMNGRIGLEQYDRCPLHLCPQCLAKLLYATGGSINKRIAEISAFARKHNLSDKSYFNKAARALR